MTKRKEAMMKVKSPSSIIGIFRLVLEFKRKRVPFRVAIKKSDFDKIGIDFKCLFEDIKE